MCLVHCEFSPIVRVTPLSQDGPRLLQRDHQESSRQKPLPVQVVFSCEHTSHFPILCLGKEPKPFPEDRCFWKKRWEHGSSGMRECSVTHGRSLDGEDVSRAGLRAEPTVLMCYRSVLCVTTHPCWCQ